MILEDHKAVFVHINKTAGSSIELFFDAIPVDQHLIASEYSEKIGSEWKNYYKFSFVRNPWDRMVSWYLWINRTKFWYDGVPSDDHLPSYPSQGEDGGNHPLVEEGWYLNLKPQFKSFLDSIDSTKDMSLYQNIYYYGNKGRWISNQLDWLKNKSGKVDIDFVGRFENIEKDFKKICAKLKVEYSPLRKAKKLNKRPHYSEFYNDKTKRIIEKLYKRDIEYFNYDFERG